jgi:hypothetical protein
MRVRTLAQTNDARQARWVGLRGPSRPGFALSSARLAGFFFEADYRAANGTRRCAVGAACGDGLSGLRIFFGVDELSDFAGLGVEDFVFGYHRCELRFLGELGLSLAAPRSRQRCAMRDLVCSGECRPPSLPSCAVNSGTRCGAEQMLSRESIC